MAHKIMLGLKYLGLDGHERVLQTFNFLELAFSNKRTEAQLFKVIGERPVVTRFPPSCHTHWVATRELNRCVSRAVDVSFQIWSSGQVTLDYCVQRDPGAYAVSKISLS